MSVLDTVKQIEASLIKLQSIDFGYPLGMNVIWPSSNAFSQSRSVTDRNGGDRWLMPLYAVCDGLRAPDVHNGYFLKSLAELLPLESSSEPDTLIAEREIPILPFGSTGNGSLFVVECEEGRVLLLPPGPVWNRRYDGRRSKFHNVAPNVPRFLELLSADFEAFVNDDGGHVYFTDLG